MNKKEYNKTKSKLKNQIGSELDLELAKINVILQAIRKLTRTNKISGSTEFNLFLTIGGICKNIYKMSVYKKIGKKIFNRKLTNESFYSILILLRSVFEGFIILQWILG